MGSAFNPFHFVRFFAKSGTASAKNIAICPIVPLEQQSFFFYGTIFRRKLKQLRHLTRPTLDILMHKMGRIVANSCKKWGNVGHPANPAVHHVSICLPICLNSGTGFSWDACDTVKNPARAKTAGRGTKVEQVSLLIFADEFLEFQFIGVVGDLFEELFVFLGGQLVRFGQLIKVGKLQMAFGHSYRV
jgi:hypothetical protein